LGKPFNEMAYITAGMVGFDGSSPVISSTVQAIVVVCGLEKVAIKDATNKVFNIRDVKAPRELTFDLSNIWEVDNTGLLQT